MYLYLILMGVWPRVELLRLSISKKCRLTKQQYYPYDTIQVSVQLKNTGKMEGKEVIQVYVRDMVSSVMTPVKQLKAFTKVGLRPGELKKVNLFDTSE